MKSIFTFTFFVALTTFSVNANAQSNSAAQETATDNPGSNIDLAPPAIEPAHVISDDGQKIYFLATPAVNPENPAVKQAEVNQRQNGNGQPARKPE